MMAEFQVESENKLLRHAIERIGQYIAENKPKNIEFIGQRLPALVKTHLKKISDQLSEKEKAKQQQIESLRIANCNAGATNSFFRESIQRIISFQQLDEEQLNEDHRSVIQDNIKLIIKLSDIFRDFQNSKNQQDNRILIMESSLEYKNKEIFQISCQLQFKQEQFQNKKKEFELQKKNWQIELQNISLESISRRYDSFTVLKNMQQFTEVRETNTELLEQLQKKQLLIEEFGKQLRKKDEQLRELKEKSRIPNTHSRAYSSINSSSIPSDASISLPEILIEVLEKAMVKKIVKNEVLYNYAEHKRINFHQLIDRKQNVLLICLTTQGTIFGGFSSAGFSLNDQPVGSVAFLFSIENGQISMRNLKEGRNSINYDCDFLVFGNDQISIQKGKNYLTSYIPVASQYELHYASADKDFFSQINEKSQIELRNYEVYSLVFD